MKSILPLLLSLLVTTSIHAKENRGVAQTFDVGSHKTGVKCGLPDTWEDVSDQTLVMDLSQPMKKNRVKSLPKTIKNQLIKTAQYNIKMTGETDSIKNIKNTVDAVTYLREISEAEDVYVYKVQYKGKIFAAVSHFPGGNHCGLIFPWGATEPIALIDDDEIHCAK